MKKFEYTITEPHGIHARPAGLLVKEAKKYSSRCVLYLADKKAELTKLMRLMALGIKKGMTVTVEVQGEDEEEAAAALEQFFKENF